MKGILILILISVSSYFVYDFFKYKPDYSIVLGSVPVQEDINIENFEKDGFEITKLKKYEVEARVLSKKEYSKKPEDKISTYDLALGWNTMSNMKHIDNIRISQSGRWYHWRFKEGELSMNDIAWNSSNNHMIHNNEETLKILDDIKQYQIIKVKGYLVSVKNPQKKEVFKSSLSRTDTGAGACEVIYIEEIEILE